MLTAKETLKVLQIIRKKAIKKHKDPAQGFWASLRTVFLFLLPAVDIGCCKTFWVFCRKVSVITSGKNVSFCTKCFLLYQICYAQLAYVICFDYLLYFSTNSRLFQVCLSQAMRISNT